MRSANTDFLFLETRYVLGGCPLPPGRNRFRLRVNCASELALYSLTEGARSPFHAEPTHCLELALYHSLGKLPEPESTHEFF
jgi:hypothetical protein